jgi:hypothetical protein
MKCYIHGCSRNLIHGTGDILVIHLPNEYKCFLTESEPVTLTVILQVYIKIIILIINY